MRKEVIFAIIIGALFGVAIVIGIRRLNTAPEAQQESKRSEIAVSNEQDETSTVIEQNTNAGKIFLAVSSPENKSVLTENPVKITGLTLPNTWVTLISDEDENIILSNSNGEFDFEVELSGGLNLFKIVAIDANGNRASEELKLVFTTQLDK